MRKLAAFVEGHTEAVFLERLLEEVAGQARVRIEQREIRGGRAAGRTMRLIKASRSRTGQEFFVLIVDCGGDELVKTRILEEHQNLTNAGYSRIIGLRDVRPTFTHADLPRLAANLPKYVKTSLIPVDFVLAIMEIEAWFLAETTHYQKIDPAITVDAIRTTLGFDPENDDLQQRPTPAEDLKNCYEIGGKEYLKHDAKATVDALDYALFYLQFPKRFASVAQLVSSIEKFLA